MGREECSCADYWACLVSLGARVRYARDCVQALDVPRLSTSLGGRSHRARMYRGFLWWWWWHGGSALEGCWQGQGGSQRPGGWDVPVSGGRQPMRGAARRPFFNVARLMGHFGWGKPSKNRTCAPSGDRGAAGKVLRRGPDGRGPHVGACVLSLAASAAARWARIVAICVCVQAGRCVDRQRPHAKAAAPTSTGRERGAGRGGGAQGASFAPLARCGGSGGGI